MHCLLAYTTPSSDSRRFRYTTHRTVLSIMASLHDNNREDDSSTDDEMPSLEMTESHTTSGSRPPKTSSPRSDSSTPTRRLVRAVRPKNEGAPNLALYRPQLPTGDNPTNTPALTSVPLAVGWDLFPPAVPSAGIDYASGQNEGNDEEDDNDGADSNADPNQNPYAALQQASETSEDDEDEDEEEEDDDDDEILSYHSSEYDSEEPEDDEDDDDDDDGPPEMPRGMLNFFRMMSAMQDDEEDDDDDDDDSGPCTCPHCMMERFGCEEAEISDSEEESEAPLDPNASACAICMEPETSTRKFLHLPCCDGVGQAATASSTRFCQKCVARYMAKNGSGVPKTDPRSDVGMLAGECPRCKHLLVLEEDDPSSYTDHRPFYKRTRAVKASTQSLHWYIARKDGGQYRAYLLTLGWCQPHYIPEELLLNDTGSMNRITHLCQWGLLEKVKGSSTAANKKSFLSDRVRHFSKWLHQQCPDAFDDPDSPCSLPNTAGWVYQIDPQTQLELQKLMLLHLEIDSDDDFQLRLTPWDSEENGRRHSFMVACNFTASAWMALCKFRFTRAIRMLNRGVSLALMSSKRLLPPVSEWSDVPSRRAACWHALTLLNCMLVFLVLRILQQALWIVGYVAQAYFVCQFVGSCIVTPKSTWKKWCRNGTILYAVIYGLYKLWGLYTDLAGQEAVVIAVVEDEL